MALVEWRGDNRQKEKLKTKEERMRTRARPTRQHSRPVQKEVKERKEGKERQCSINNTSNKQYYIINNISIYYLFVKKAKN